MPIDPYVYPGTQTLINRFDIRDAEELQRIESANFILKQHDPLPQGNLDFDHLKAVHRHFFGEIYTWAGQERTVDISKSDSLFCLSGFIHKEINKLFDQLKKEQHLQGLEKKPFCERMAHYFNEINAVHPFREGNGRTLRAFSESLAQKAGYELHWDTIDRKVYLSASIDGFKGITDSMEQVFDIISEPRLVSLSQKALLHPQSSTSEKILSDALKEKLLDYADLQKKQQQLLWAHYEARASDNRDEAKKAKEIVSEHFKELTKKSVELYHDAEIKSLMDKKYFKPSHETASWDKVKEQLHHDHDVEQAICMLLPPIKRAGFQETHALSQKQSQHKGGSRKR